MQLQVGLNIVTLVMCIITLTMASAAILYRLLPQIKQGLVILRDGLLWTLLISVVGFVGFIGWGRLFEIRQQRTNAPDASILFDNTSARTRLAADQPAVTRPVGTRQPEDLLVDHSTQPDQSWNGRTASVDANLDVTHFSRN